MDYMFIAVRRCSDANLERIVCMLDLAMWITLHVKPKVHDIPVSHHVFLAFYSHFTSFFYFCF